MRKNVYFGFNNRNEPDLIVTSKNLIKASLHTKYIFKWMRLSFSEFKKNDPLRLAASTAFFTTFALPPILIILIQLFGIFFNRYTLSSRLIERLASILGKKSALQVKQVLDNLDSISQNLYALTFGFIFLLFVATTLFIVIKNSLNQIWKVRVKNHPGLWFYLKLRGRSLLVIILAGVLFTMGIFIESLQAILGNYFDYFGSQAGNFLNRFVNEILFISVVTIWFTVIFRFLADGRPDWRVALAGGLFTSILFSIGKVIVRTCLSLSNISTIYGASGSIVLIMLFVFYSSFIFYYGGCFIKAMSEDLDLPITPVKEAFRYEVQEIIRD